MGTNELPQDLLRGRRRFQVWRGRRKGRERIPQSLWSLAVGLARTYGVSRTSTALGLDYYSLKRQVEAVADEPPSRGRSGPAFVELPAPLLVGKQSLFELDNGAGASMRVQLVGYDAADLEALARSFWNAE
jgi:hypothetical protein